MATKSSQGLFWLTKLIFAQVLGISSRSSSLHYLESLDRFPPLLLPANAFRNGKAQGKVKGTRSLGLTGTGRYC